MNEFVLTYSGQTVLHPIGLAALLIGIALTLFLPRVYALIPILIICAVLPSAQRITILMMDFSIIRIVIIFGLIRLLIRKELPSGQKSPIDILILIYAVVGISAFTIQGATMGAFANRTGYMLEAVGAYLLARCLIIDERGVIRIASAFCILIVPSVALFVYEQQSGHNLMSIFGGVPEQTLIRDGRLRSQGPFSHSILAGGFWASIIPIIAIIGRHRKWLWVAMSLGIVTIIASTASSTPVFALLASLLGLLAFPWRSRLGQIRVAVLVLLIVLHFARDKPVWHLISRIDVVGGSTGWHRFNLIDQAINHFSEWALIGLSSTGHWGWGLHDITNQYILEGVRGGALSMVLFIAMIVLVFRGLGVQMRRSRGMPREWIAWCIGTCMFVHCTNFLAVAYFGQLVSIYFLFMGLSVSFSCLPTLNVERKASTSQPSVGLRYLD